MNKFIFFLDYRVASRHNHFGVTKTKRIEVQAANTPSAYKKVCLDYPSHDISMFWPV